MAAYYIFECYYNISPWALYFSIYCPISKPHKPHSFSFPHSWYFLLSLLSYVSFTLSDGLQFLFLGARCPVPNSVLHLLGLCQSWVKWNDFLCVIYYIVGSSLWSLPLFSAYTVISYSIFNFLPSLYFSFQSVVWFVFCLIDFRLILQGPFLVLFPSFKALCHFIQADVTAKLCQCTHMPSPRLLMDVGYKTVPRMTYCGTPPEKASQNDNKPSITALWEQFCKCCAPTGLLLTSGMHWRGLLSKMLCGTMSKACHCHDASYLLFALIY